MSKGRKLTQQQKDLENGLKKNMGVDKVWRARYGKAKEAEKLVIHKDAIKDIEEFKRLTYYDEVSKLGDWDIERLKKIMETTPKPGLGGYRNIPFPRGENRYIGDDEFHERMVELAPGFPPVKVFQKRERGRRNFQISLDGNYWFDEGTEWDIGYLKYALSRQGWAHDIVQQVADHMEQARKNNYDLTHAPDVNKTPAENWADKWARQNGNQAKA